MKHLEDIVEKLKGELENSDQVCCLCSDDSFLLSYKFAGHVLTLMPRLYWVLVFFFLSKGFVLLSLSDKVLQPRWPGSHELCGLLVVDLRIQVCAYWGPAALEGTAASRGLWKSTLCPKLCQYD